MNSPPILFFNKVKVIRNLIFGILKINVKTMFPVTNFCFSNDKPPFLL